MPTADRMEATRRRQLLRPVSMLPPGHPVEPPARNGICAGRISALPATPPRVRPAGLWCAAAIAPRLAMVHLGYPPHRRLRPTVAMAHPLGYGAIRPGAVKPNNPLRPLTLSDIFQRARSATPALSDAGIDRHHGRGDPAIISLVALFGPAAITGDIVTGRPRADRRW